MSEKNCLTCFAPARGSSLDFDGWTLIWYCRSHHPMMPGGQPVRGRWVWKTNVRAEWVPAEEASQP